MSDGSDRRDFLKVSALAGVGFWVAGAGSANAQPRSPNEKVNFACIGVGGKGDSDTEHCGKLGNVVALCDIDENRLNAKGARFPQAKKYTDFRKMFDEMAAQIDAVSVSTPDHTHAPASVMAMKLGKHVYCQKPLTHSVYEARTMRETAEKMKVATQMGNQGTAEDGLRRAVEVIRAGVIGDVTEVHVWTNRPIWPQGADAILRVGPARQAALAALYKRSPGELKYPSVPAHVNWDAFLGPAPERPYDPIYHPFAWRGWWDFGTGALGDMACHTANMPFMALKLSHPTSVVASDVEGLNPETAPTQAKITYEFPARDGMKPVKMIWYEGQRGGRKLLPPRDLAKGREYSDSGCLLVGTKGVLYSPSDYGGSYQLLPEKEFADYKGPEPTLPRRPRGTSNDEWMKQEWINAMRGGPPAMSNFSYAGMLTEVVLLGNAAIRVGKKIEWDGPHLRAVNCPEADQYIKREYRKGWTL